MLLRFLSAFHDAKGNSNDIWVGSDVSNIEANNKIPLLPPLTFLLSLFQSPSHSVGVKAGADCCVIDFILDNCFGLIDIENWNETFVREASGVFIPHCP